MPKRLARFLSESTLRFASSSSSSSRSVSAAFFLAHIFFSSLCRLINIAMIARRVFRLILLSAISNFLSYSFYCGVDPYQHFHRPRFEPFPVLGRAPFRAKIVAVIIATAVGLIRFVTKTTEHHWLFLFEVQVTLFLIGFP